jgi:hypothetical protein
MRVYINRKGIDIFTGATLRDVLLSYSKHCYKLVQNGYLAVYDRFGFITGTDGPVLDEQHFFLKVAEKKEKKF